MTTLIGAITGFLVILAYTLGCIKGKGIKIEHIQPEFEGEYLEQPKLLDPEVENYINENGGFKF